MSDYTIPTSNTVTTIDPQATKIRELQSDVTQLENRLRALWDKLEGERKFYDQRIREIEIAGSANHCSFIIRSTSLAASVAGMDSLTVNPPSRSTRMICVVGLDIGWLLVEK